MVALDVDKEWIFTIDEARELAQQHSDRGMRQLYWRLEPRSGLATPRHEGVMTSYQLEQRAPALFLAEH